MVTFGLARCKVRFIVGKAEVDCKYFVQLVKLFRILIEKFRVRRFPFGDGEELGTIPADLAVNGVPDFFAAGALGLLIILESFFLLVPRMKKVVDDGVRWEGWRRCGMVREELGEELGHANKSEVFGEGRKALVFAVLDVGL